MKKYCQVFLVLVLSTVIVCAEPRNRFEAGMLNVIERCKAGNVSSLPMAFPSLNPLIISPKDVHEDRYTMSFGELTVEGLENLSVEKLSTSPHNLSISIEVSVPSMTVRADHYHLVVRGFWGIKYIDEVGKFRCDVNKLVVRGTLQLGSDQYGGAVITNIHIEYTVSNIQAELTGSAFFVKYIANANIRSMIKDSAFVRKIECMIVDGAEEHLRRYSLPGFITMISEES